MKLFIFTFLFLSQAFAEPNCRESVRCPSHGECVFKQGRCGPGSENDCRQAEYCKVSGSCSFQNGACVALKDDDCKKSKRCSDFGHCNARGLNCVPVSDADCKSSLGCKNFRNCSFYERKSSAGVPASSLCVRDVKAAQAGENETNCKAAGGRWLGTVIGRGRMTGCLLPTHDKGKECKDSSECESVCVNFKCHGWSDFRGCGLVEKGKTICVE